MKNKNIKNVECGAEDFTKTIKDSLFKRAVGGNVLEETADFELKNKGKFVFCERQNAIIMPYGVLYECVGENAKFKFSDGMSFEKLKKICINCDGKGLKCMENANKNSFEKAEKGVAGGKTTEKAIGENKMEGIYKSKNLNSKSKTKKNIDVEGVPKKSKQGKSGVYFCEDVKDKLMGEKMVCVKKKVSKKYSPPDTQAVKMLIEMNEGVDGGFLGITSELDSLNNAQLEKMKNELIKKILE